MVLPISVVALISRSLGRFYEFLMGDGEINFKLCPSAVGVGFTLPDFAIIIEHTCLKDDIKCCVYDLNGSEGGVTGRCILYSIFDLVEKMSIGRLQS